MSKSLGNGFPYWNQVFVGVVGFTAISGFYLLIWRQDLLDTFAGYAAEALVWVTAFIGGAFLTLALNVLLSNPNGAGMTFFSTVSVFVAVAMIVASHSKRSDDPHLGPVATPTPPYII